MRTVLYANKDLSTFLNDNFVLLWSSERPVPKVTIDFGDGRVLERTITGNAVHYVLDADGNPIDALPGLYGPAVFKAAMERSVKLHGVLMAKIADDRAAFLRTYHRARMALLSESFAGDLALTGAELPAVTGLPPTEFFTPDDSTSLREVDGELALRAIDRAVTKSGIERDLGLLISRFDRRVLEASANDDAWRKMAALHANSGIDNRTLAVMARELPEFEGRVLDGLTADSVRKAADPFAAEKAIERAVGKTRMGEGRMVVLLNEADTSLAKMLTNFEEALAQDTLRNEYVFHAQIHQWFIDETFTLATLNERVYREVFLTPRSDPWLGLGDSGDYTGIAEGGRHE